ncbi:heavy-metal-associated domain-containing protein [Thermodesulfobacteriota bacterium]
MTTINIKGMSCNHCVMAVTKALDEIEGIKDPKVDLDGGNATFEMISQVDMDLIKEKIKQAGYEVA